MKKLLYLVLLLTGFTQAQIINFPDAIFKAKLLEADITNNIATTPTGQYIKIDVNNDGEIQETEALQVYYLRIQSINVTNLSGIEYFSNISGLICSDNPLLETFDGTALVNCTGLSLVGNLSLVSVDVSHLLNLTGLYLDYNPNLTSVNLSGLTNLEGLTISQSQNFTSLDVSHMQNLVELHCQFNNLTSLNITGLSHLSILDCFGNQLTTIDFTGVGNEFYSLSCFDNQITDLIFPELITSIQAIDCSNNQISYLDLSNVIIDFSNFELFNGVDFSNNPIEYINLKNNFVEIPSSGLYNFIGLPSLAHVCLDDEELNNFQDALALAGLDGTIAINSYCSFVPGGNYNTITGNITYDANSNGCDVNDLDFSGIRININDGTTTGASFTNNSGNYTFYTQAGSFNITPSFENPSWFNISPPTNTILFADNNNNSATQDFCLTANGVHPDVEVVIVPINPARPGFDAVYKIVYRNKGNQTHEVFVNFDYDDNLLDFVSSSVTPEGQGNGVMGWIIPALHPFESGSILVTFNVNSPMETPAVNIGDVLNFNAFVDITTDENWDDNNFDLAQIVVGSYDPNDITCLEGDLVSPSQIGNYLHYNVRFENTGTAAAENIVVKIEVNPADFDINSLQLMNASNPVDARINGNKIEFIFQGIMLDSGGHGNVLLKVKTNPGLSIGDLVAKKANIYFDYNFPVETNNAETVFQALNNQNFEQDNSIKIYPNPATSIVNINGNFNVKSVELFDVQGRLLETNLVNQQTTTLDISSKSKGVYFIKITSDKGIKVEKIVKE